MSEIEIQADTRRYALRIAYEGGTFPGWQTQPSGEAIQDRVEAALSTVAGHPVRTICAGRTDAGVHALAQVIHFDTVAQRPDSAWMRGTNALLPPGVAVQGVVQVDPAFHARYSAVRRAYEYVLYRAPARHPLLAARAGWVFRRLDAAAMAAAAALLVGEHDFTSFRSSQCQARSPVRRLDRLELRESGPLLLIDLQANAFLHHMVRNIVGALVWVGMGRRPPQWVGEVLAARDRRLAAPTFAAEGLYLAGVEYAPGNDPGSWPPHRAPIVGA